MKVDFKDATIKIRRKEGVVLVIDSGVPFDLFEIVKNQAMDMDIPFRIGALSHDKEIDKEIKEINEGDIQNLGQMLRNRGRFITPLIEGFFRQLADKEYDLILLHSGKVYDLDDYESELLSKFGRKVPVAVNEKKRTDNEWITHFKSETKIFNFSIGDIEISINSAVPLEWDDFNISIDTSKRQFILKKSTNDKKMDICLETRGRTKDADADVEVKVKVNDLTYPGKIKNGTNFIAPQWKPLVLNDEHIFRVHMEEYLKSNFNLECPLCHRKHTFEKPFFCSKQSGDILLGQLTQGALILKDLSSYQKGFVLFRADGNGVTYLTSEKEVLEFEDLRFIFVLNGQVYEVTCRDRSLEIKEGDKIHSNLYELGKGNIVYLF